MVSISSLKLFALNDFSNECRDGEITFFEAIDQEIYPVFVVEIQVSRNRAGQKSFRQAFGKSTFAVTN